VVIVQREALPFGPAWVEAAIARRRPVVWDVDDAIWEEYPSLYVRWLPRALRKTGRKYERLAALAAEVWAGSEVLARWCRRHARTVRVVPTVVDVPERVSRPPRGRVAGWVGSPSTGPFLERVLPAVAQVADPPRLVVVGAEPAVPAELNATVTPWSPAAEEAALAAMRVGLYPIDAAHPLAAGKCGLKAILYMARGIPVVTTPTETNAAIVRDGVEGLHAVSAADWTAAVQRLLDDPALWERCSAAAHRRALEDFSLRAWGPRVSHYLKDLARPSAPATGTAARLRRASPATPVVTSSLRPPALRTAARYRPPAARR
jgi:glycosyltransferase involved in cell wall biosynthesis